MDLLSRLLALIPVSGTVDVRCHYGAPWRHPYPAAQLREIPYHILLRGSALVESDDAPPLRMGAGDILLFPSGEAHVLVDDSGEPARERRRSRSASLTVIRNGGKNAAANMLCGRFLLPSVPQQLLRDNLPRQLLVRGAGADADIGASDAGSRLARLIQLMREEALEQGPGSEAMMNHLSGALFGMTLRFASEALVPPRGLLALARRPRLQPAFNAMFERPGVAWSLPELARLCSMSRATFTRHFSAATGRSAADLLSEIRMTLAGRLLAQTARSVADIGQEVGYQSDAAFQRAFKKQVGATPAQWRQQARSEH